MELLQLRYFYESAKSESFARTAQKYLVPTTSVSASIKRLETELGCKLFDRFPNKIALSPSGRQLFHSLHKIFEELDSTLSLLSEGAKPKQEIRMLVRAMRARITDVIIDYARHDSSVSVKTVFDFETNNTEEYDIIIDDDPKKYPDFAKFELCSKRLLLKVSKNSPLYGKPLTLRQLSGEPFLSMGEHSSMHRTIFSACETCGFSPNIVILTNDSQCYRKCLEAGIGIGIGRDDSTDNSSEVRFLNVTDLDARQTVYCFYKIEKNHGSLARFTEFLKSTKF